MSDTKHVDLYNFMVTPTHIAVKSTDTCLVRHAYDIRPVNVSRVSARPVLKVSVSACLSLIVT